MWLSGWSHASDIWPWGREKLKFGSNMVDWLRFQEWKERVSGREIEAGIYTCGWMVESEFNQMVFQFSFDIYLVEWLISHKWHYTEWVRERLELGKNVVEWLISQEWHQTECGWGKLRFGDDVVDWLRFQGRRERDISVRGWSGWVGELLRVTPDKVSERYI